MVAAILAAALLFAAIYAIFWGLSKEVHYRLDAESHQAEYYRNTYSPEREACITLAVKDQMHCLSKAHEAERSNERNEQDLVAQRTSALWTYLMSGAAFAGVVLSAFGVFLVWTTFNATREANAIAREIGQAQTRAYLSTIRASFSSFGSDITMRIVTQNTGNSPAKDVEISLRIYSHWIEEDAGFDEPYSEVSFVTAPKSFGGVSSGIEKPLLVSIFTFGGQTGQDELFAKIYEGHFFRMGVTIKWTDVFGDIFSETFLLISDAALPFIVEKDELPRRDGTMSITSDIAHA